MARKKPKSRNNSASPAPLAIAILAAGKGTRIKSRHPKVLHQVGGKPMLAHVIAAARQVLEPQHIYAIIGYEADRVRHTVESTGIGFVLQEPQRGTGHALMVARDLLIGYDHVLVLSGDVPLISAATMTRLRDLHWRKRAAMTILTANVAEPSGYGRILRRPGSDEVRAIVEEKALTPTQRELREINSGIYVFATRPLFQHISKLGTDNAHREYYLTDMAALLRRAKQRVLAVPVADPHEVQGSNTRGELASLDLRLRLEKCRELMAEGVTILRPDTCVIDSDVQVRADTVIEPFVQLLGTTRVGSECRIRSYNVIEDSELADGVTIKPGCMIEGSRIESGAIIGPYSHLRPGSDIGEGAHIGNFVETKKARVGRGSKANHLTYLGDAFIGEDVNIGAGTITCNYDGVQKHPTVIEDGAFVGSDSTLVAPVRIGKGAYVAAGSSITDDVPADALGIARGRQVNKEGWARARRQAQPAKTGSTG